MSLATPAHEDVSLELTPALSERWALQLSHLVAVVLLGSCFVIVSHLPLPSSVVGQVAAGEWILDHRTLPSEDLFVGLNAGVPCGDEAWLSHVLMAAAARQFGIAGCSYLYAVSLLLAAVALLNACRTPGAGIAFSLAMLGIVFLSGLSRAPQAGPEMLGMLCLTTLLWTLRRCRRSEVRSSIGTSPAMGASGQKPDDDAPVNLDRWQTAPPDLPWSVWILVPALFAVWGNLHPSFPAGIALLACLAVGRLLDVLAMTGNVSVVLRDPVLKRRLVLTELALLATLANPVGLDLWFSLADRLPLLRSGTAPLKLTSGDGIGVALLTIATLIALRHSRVRFTAGTVIVLATAAVLTAWRASLLLWSAPIVVAVLVPHLDDIWQRTVSRLRARLPELFERLELRSFRYSLLCGLLVWISFAFSPVSQPVLGGPAKSVQMQLSPDTPHGISAWLRDHPPQGQIANPLGWGDWLLRDGPPGLQVFVTEQSEWHMPQRVWLDYLTIAGAQEGLENVLDRYRVNTLVVSSQQDALMRRVRRLDGWRIVYRDDQGLIARRGVQ